MTTQITVHNPGPGVVCVHVYYKPQTHSDDPYVIDTQYLSPNQTAQFIVHAFQYIKVDETRPRV